VALTALPLQRIRGWPAASALGCGDASPFSAAFGRERERDSFCSSGGGPSFVWHPPGRCACAACCFISSAHRASCCWHRHGDFLRLKPSTHLRCLCHLRAIRSSSWRTLRSDLLAGAACPNSNAAHQARGDNMWRHNRRVRGGCAATFACGMPSGISCGMLYLPLPVCLCPA